jgi:L-amino acid N-acyltransferase YncA
MKIRDAASADLPHIVAIYNASIPGRMATADTAPISVTSRIEWLHEHDPERHPLWVVEADAPRSGVSSSASGPASATALPISDGPGEGGIVGWLSFHRYHTRPAYHRTAELSVYIAPSHQRAGIGRMLLRKAVTRAPELNLATLLGFIFGHNGPSLALFERHGFSRWGVLSRVAELDGIERDVVVLGLRVDASRTRQDMVD